MRGTTLRLKAQELYNRALDARSPKAVLLAFKELIDLICADRRRTVTPELRAAVLKAASKGAKTADMEEQFKLSAPTIRKIVRSGDGRVAP